jgi:hypothetical protein
MRLQSCAMRIVYIRPGPLAGVFAITYAVVGLSAFVVYTVSSVQMFTLPIGIIIGIFHMNLNINLPRSADALGNAFLCGGAVLSYALCGWISGLAVGLCFNFVARRTGGIDAKFVSVADDYSAAKRQMA